MKLSLIISGFNKASFRVDIVQGRKKERKTEERKKEQNLLLAKPSQQG